ncbi:hypothetical protein O6H91_14G069700 [Diphasiastrum complanatum]|nr:hypothetical protein O6H91_14G069700 [Diphasiastrum complanatum]
MQLASYFRASITDPGEVTGLMKSLKESLARTLDVFPALAGRLSKENGTGRLKLDVNGAGIPFFEASIDARMDEWEHLFYSPVEEQLNPMDHYVPDVLEVPLCRVQVTIFSCGGVAIGFSALHTAFDGLGAVEFLIAWGEIHRGLAISTPPDFSTELLKARNPPEVRMQMPEIITSLFEESRAAASSVPTPPLFPDGAFNPSNFLGGKTILLHLSAKMVDQCVKEVEEGAHSYGHVSSFEAISALVWTAITRARVPPEDEITNYTFPVNIRGEGRWEPPLPRGYFGNAVMNSMATAKVENILSNDISFAAQTIHKVIQQVTPEFVRSAMDWIELQMQEGLSIGRLKQLSPCSVGSTSFANFPISSIDFGFGNLLHLGQTMIPMMTQLGAVQLLPSPGGDRRSRQVVIGLPEPAMSRLLEDEDFVRYFPGLKN